MSRAARAPLNVYRVGESGKRDGSLPVDWRRVRRVLWRAIAVNRSTSSRSEMRLATPELVRCATRLSSSRRFAGGRA